MTKPIKVRPFDGTQKQYYSLSDTCKVLGRARSTLMRLLPKWQEVTGHEPRKDHRNRWYLTVQSVHALEKNPDLYLQLAGRATKWTSEVRRLREENTALRSEVRLLSKKLKQANNRYIKACLPD